MKTALARSAALSPTISTTRCSTTATWTSISAARRRWLTRLLWRCATAALPRRGSGMRNSSPARARRRQEAKCVLPIKSSSSPARRRALAARRRSRRLQKARLCCSSIARHTSMSWRRRWRNPAVWCWRWRRILEAWESTEQAFAAGVAHFGRIDVLIDNVGGTIWARPFAEYQPGSD